MKLSTVFKTTPARVMSLVIGAGVVTMFAHFLFGATTDYQNTIRIREIAQQTLQRTERAADYALITLSDLISVGHDNCAPESMEHIRQSIYLRGVIKDVRVLGADNETLCAGLAHSSDVPMSRFDSDSGVPSLNDNISFHLMGARNTGLIGISWAVSANRTMLAILNIDSLMFDIYPRSLREEATAGLLMEEEQFARYEPPGKKLVNRKDWRNFLTVSDRYPISVRLSVSPQAFSVWNREAEPYALAIAALLGAMLGYLGALAASRDRDMTSELRKALRRREFIGHVQPIFELGSLRIVSGETLARWQKPDGTIIPPNDFIGLAEDNGLIVPITWQIMEHTLSAMEVFLRARPDIRLGFNIAPTHMMSKGFIDDFLAIINRFGVSSKQIVIEITERQQIDNLEEAAGIIQTLRDAGFLISLDDTGTGHNGLSYMQNLGIDDIKIDKHFVDLVGVDRVATKIIEMLVQLAHELNMATVAEGIESKAQLDALRALDVDKGQGYLVSKAVPPEEFITLVVKSHVAKIVQFAA